MTYRDDLAAAHARIEALEARLRALGGPQSGSTANELERLREEVRENETEAAALIRERDRLGAEVTALEARIAELGSFPVFLDKHVQQLAEELREAHERSGTIEAERDALAEQVTRLEQRLAAVGSEPLIRRLPTLWERNRSFDALTAGKPAGVTCPHCRSGGFEVEMRRDAGLAAGAVPPDLRLDLVVCPRCVAVAFVRS